jgi:3-oxoacyl-[acyl-carrier protein] reductase
MLSINIRNKIIAELYHSERQVHMDYGLKTKTAFVAGSSGGIGRAIAFALAKEGCNLMLCARRKDVLEELANTLSSDFGVTVNFYPANLDNQDELNAAIAETMKHYSGIDVLITNNGGPPPGDFESLTEELWAQGWNRTLMSTVRFIKGFLPYMKEQQWGRIINITSIAVLQPVPRLLLSNAYRAAVTGMAKTLSNEVASQGITVNNIAPGFIETQRFTNLLHDRATQASKSPEEMRTEQVKVVPAGRVGQPEELGALAAFLASEAASYITGTTIPVDGGLHKGLL